MSPLPSSERYLLGPGPSMISPRVMRALAAPVLGHLDPDLLAMMDPELKQFIEKEGIIITTWRELKKRRDARK